MPSKHDTDIQRGIDLLDDDFRWKAKSHGFTGAGTMGGLTRAWKRMIAERLESRAS